MENAALQQAISVLGAFEQSPEKAAFSREALVAFVWVETLCHYWPDRANEELLSLRQRFSFFKEIEKSRFLKQRRIISRKLADLLVRD